MNTMLNDFFLHTGLLPLGLLMMASLFLVREGGYWIGRRSSKEAAALEKQEKTVGTITGAMLALLGFMLAVSISMADSHFESRRKLVLDEANAIGTSHLRARLVGGRHGREIARLLVDYGQVRLDFYAAGEDRKRLETVYQRTAALQERIWSHAAAVARSAPTPVSALLVGSLNEVFDLSASRRWALEVRVPPSVIQLLFAFALLAMGTAGLLFRGLRSAPSLSFLHPDPRIHMGHSAHYRSEQPAGRLYPTGAIPYHLGY